MKKIKTTLNDVYIIEPDVYGDDRGWFSETFNFPLIPYIKGRALGKDITMKFADGSDALNLRLPIIFYFLFNFIHCLL